MTLAEIIHMYKWKQGFGRALGKTFGLYSGQKLIQQTWKILLITGKTHAINSHLLVPSASSFCSVFFLQHSIWCLPFSTPPIPGTAGECNLCSTADHLANSGATEVGTQTYDAVTRANEPHSTPTTTMHRGEKELSEKKKSSESKFMYSVKGVCQCCCSPLGELCFFL